MSTEQIARICPFEVEAHKVWLRGAAGGVLVALVERHVTNQVPLVAGAVPSRSTPSF